MVLLLPHFTFRLIIRFFLVRFRYTGTSISSAATVLEATLLQRISIGGRALPMSYFYPMGTISLLSDQFPPSILMPVISSDS